MKFDSVFKDALTSVISMVCNLLSGCLKEKSEKTFSRQARSNIELIAFHQE